MRQFLVAGNWKMNTRQHTARELAAAIAADVPAVQTGVDVLVCPPFPYLLTVRAALENSGVKLGAQNVYFEPPGAFTGEVAADMLRDVGCEYVIVGHSERRHVIGETDELINKKVSAALENGLAVILCVGELLDQREGGETESVLESQMLGGLQSLGETAFRRLVIAYEPVWAIGTGKTATPEQAETAHGHLRKFLQNRYNPSVGEKTRILYGGSVKPDNAAALLEQPNVDGALVGGASLKAETFLPIVKAARRLTRR